MSARPWRVGGSPELHGWWMAGDRPEGPIVILAHGWGANGGTVLPLAPAVRGVASHVVAVDIRGHGRSDDAPMVSLRQFRDDTVRLVDAVRQEAPGHGVVLVGHSLGGAGGALAGDLGAGIDGLVLVATPHDVFGSIARYLVEKGLPGHFLVPFLTPFWRVRIGLPTHRLHPGQALARQDDLRTLVIQPELDTRVPPGDGESLARASSTEMALIPGAGHTDVLRHPMTARLVQDFVAAS